MTIRRTRRDLVENEFYQKDLEKQGIVFPEIKEPQVLLYQLNEEINRFYETTLEKLTSKTGLQYTRYKIINYLLPQYKKNYQMQTIFHCNYQAL